MRSGHLRGIVASFVVCLVALLVLSGIPGLTAAYTPKADTRQADLILKVGGQDEMKTRNLLPATANDVWTSDVHYRAYHSVLLGHPQLDRPMAYIAKGTDFDEDGMFEPSTEYDVWAEQSNPTSPLVITIYYDFNGVFWHDNVQMNVWDLLFSYHVAAMNPRFNTDLRVLYCAVGSSYDSCGRQLNIEIVAKNWEGEGTMAGDPNLRVAVRWTLNQAFALFYDSTLFPVMLPMHEWSRTYGGKHVDFGCAVWIPTTEATARGITECGTTDNTKWGHGIATTEPVPGSRPYNYPGAEQWTTMTDADVIGNGPFKFTSWIPGVEAKVTRNEKYFTGVDPNNPSIVYDAQLARVLVKPTIEGIRYLVYRTTQLGVFALQGAKIDFYHWNVGAEFVPDLLKIPSIAVESNAEPGFFYMGYNFRREPWGYVGGNPANGDRGYWLRQAFSHVIDKESIVQNLLQNFGVVGHGTVSPANTFWYNDNIPKPEYDLAQARAVLDDLATDDPANPNDPYDPGFSLDPPGACSRDTPSGCRTLPRIGNNFFEILTPQADYDPVRASAGAMVADAMRQVGVNAVSRPTAFGEIVTRITIHDFDVYILGWRIGGTDPDYLFSFFHSSNAPSGQNYVGFQNQAFDAAIENSRTSLDRTTRLGYIKDAQLTLAQERPYDVLYFRTNIEGYRQDRFVNWTVSSGTIWGFWSLEGIHPPSTNALRLLISADSATSSGSSVSVIATVFDNSGTALPDATVDLSVDQGSISPATGTTDSNGRVTATITAPIVTAKASIILQATASAPTLGFPDPVSRNAVVQVFPPGVSFLALLAELPLGDRVTAGASLPMSIGVKDDAGNTIGDALVGVTTSAGTLSPDPQSGQAATMTSVTLSASATVATSTEVTVTVTATRTGFEPASTDQKVTIVPTTEQPHLCPDGNYYPASQPCPTVSTPGLEVLPVLAGIGIAALVAGVMAERKRRS